MNVKREKLRRAGLLEAYESACRAREVDRLRALLDKAGFSELEIDSILWAKGDLGPDAPDPKKSDRIIGVIGQTVISGIIVGAVSAYVWGGFAGSFSETASVRTEAHERVMIDHRSPWEAYYRPFLIGCGLGILLPALHRLSRPAKKGR